MVDWLSPEILDIVWYKLASWEGVWSYWEGRFSSPLCMVVTIRSLSTTIRAQTPITSLWDSISRPYLSYVDLEYGGRVLLCEYAARRFVHSITEVFKNDNNIHVSFAGGFASWQLERRIHTVHKLDAFPRCIRDTTFHDGLPRNELWIPLDIDVFFTGDANVVLPVIQTAYFCFCKLLFKYLDYSDACVEEHSSLYEWIGEDNLQGDHTELLRRTMIEAQFPFVIIDEALRTLENGIYCQQDDSILLKTWRLKSCLEPLFPTEINIVQTKHHTENLSYSLWLTQYFDLVHCCVSLTVDEESGGWLFECSDVVIDCIKHRLLRFNASNFGSLETTILIVKRLIKYYKNGFTFRGDIFHSMLSVA